MTNEQSATLLRLNKQAQVAALNAVGFSDITENSRASEFGQRIKWAAGLLDLNLACNRISDNSKWYFTREEWDSLTVTNKQLFIKRGLRIRAHGHSFVISAAAEAARAYRAYTLESDGIEDESNWFLPSSGQMLLMYRYRDKINEMMRTFWSSDSMLMTDKYYWSSTIWDTNSAWAFELNTGRITNQNKNSALLHVRAVASE